MKRISLIAFLILNCVFLFGQTSNQKDDLNQELIFTIVEKMPSFPGGEKELEKYIRDNLYYPENARNNRIGGTVYLTFVIEKDGSITHISILKGIPNGADLNLEAVRIIRSMPNWIGAQQDAVPVRVGYNLAIRFDLESYHKKTSIPTNVYTNETFKQTKIDALNAYEKAVNYFKEGKLEEADSLFSISLDLEPNVDAFYNKAIVNKKLGNTGIYCANIEYAKILEDKESARLFCNDCATIDSFYVTESYKKALPENYFYKLKFMQSKYSSYLEFYRYTNNNKMDLSYYVRDKDTVYTFIPEKLMQPYVDTIMKYINYVYNRYLQYPQKEKQSGIQGIIYIRFNVNKEGRVENVKVIRSHSDGLAEEAVRIIYLLPKLKPFIYQGQPVKLELSLPVRFSLAKD